MKDNESLSSRPSVYILEDEFSALRSLAGSIDDGGGASLRSELERAVLIPRHARPAGLVTMNAKVRYEDVDSGGAEELFLVWPQRADPAQNCISVLSPIGSALIGFRVGDEVTWPTPGGLRRLRIVEVQHDRAPKVDATVEASDIIRLLTGR